MRALALPQDRIQVWLVLGTSNHDGRRKSPTESVNRTCMFLHATDDYSEEERAAAAPRRTLLMITPAAAAAAANDLGLSVDIVKRAACSALISVARRWRCDRPRQPSARHSKSNNRQSCSGACSLTAPITRRTRRRSRPVLSGGLKFKTNTVKARP